MATEFVDYRGYRITLSTPAGATMVSVMINPIEALRALSHRPEGATRERALEEARLIVDRALDAPPDSPPRGNGLARLIGSAFRGAGARRSSSRGVLA
jgi:hypothetical protein